MRKLLHSVVADSNLCWCVFEFVVWPQIQHHRHSVCLCWCHSDGTLSSGECMRNHLVVLAMMNRDFYVIVLNM